MKTRQTRLLLLALSFAPATILPALGADTSVLTYHNANIRGGLYEVNGLTTAAAANIHPDAAFHAAFRGEVYAQPLYWKPSGAAAGLLILATEGNLILGINADTGATVWQKQLPAPAALGDLQCGNIDPEGITGTPAIDPAKGIVYFDALTKTAHGPRQMIYGVSASEGRVAPGWPLDVQAALAANGISFDSTIQGERSAVLLDRGNLYVEYGGRYGDCGSYHGVVVQVQTATKALSASWSTRAKGGGIWAQGGAASDGTDLFVTTGNTFNSDSSWGDGEAIVRLKPGLAHSNANPDYFTPANWRDLDEEDADLGGTEALPIQVDGAPRLIAMGKDGKAYLVNRGDLGGVGRQIADVKVSRRSIITAPAVYNTSAEALVAFTNANGLACSRSNVTMLSVSSNPTAPISVKWCSPFKGRGAPIITTSGDDLNPVVWVVGAEGDSRLHGFDAKTGAEIFAGGTGSAMSGLRHFQTLIAANHHLYVGADNTVFAFKFGK